MDYQGTPDLEAWASRLFGCRLDRMVSGTEHQRWVAFGVDRSSAGKVLSGCGCTLDGLHPATCRSSKMSNFNVRSLNKASVSACASPQKTEIFKSILE